MIEKPKKTRRRRQKDSSTETDKENPKFYFTSLTQDAIVEFQQCTDRRTREKLYVEKIMPAFEKLVENLINIHKFMIPFIYNFFC